MYFNLIKIYSDHKPKVVKSVCTYIAERGLPCTVCIASYLRGPVAGGGGGGGGGGFVNPGIYS